MSGHLTSQQIFEWVSGERPLDVQRHVAECEVCRSECESFGGALAGFRDSMRHWSHTQQPRQPSMIRPSLWRGSAHLVVAALAVAACLMLAMLLPSRTERKPGTNTAVVTDTVLLKQIDSEVSRTAPEAMEPLMSLVTWDGPKESQ